MGMVFSYSCSCGSVDGFIAFGAGMLDFTTHCAIPASCTTCRDVVEAEYFDSIPKCPSCGSGVTLLAERLSEDKGFGPTWSPEEGVVLCLPLSGNECPACGKDELSFIDDDMVINFD